MVFPTVQRKLALLVGVDLYLNNGSRRLPKGTAVSLTNLKGAVNDVQNIKEILERQFQFSDFIILTSAPSVTDPSVPREPEGSWPTHANIKNAFDNIREKAQPGDIFFFHFSGHGALLPTTLSPPADGRSMDPSLLTADYCCGEPAIRGWELNIWLQEFNKKNVRVIVLLDSCYSGGAWRTGERFRSPENWTPPPNLPSDEVAVQGAQKKPGHRDGDLSIDWDINPKDFTLIAACQRAEKAAEKDGDGVANGAFTLALKICLQDMPNPSVSTYHALRDRTTHLLASWDISQTPQVFGRDRLAFLEDYEPFLATPIIGSLQEGELYLPVGKIHGINKGTEFITTSSPRVIVSVSKIDDYESKAEILEGSILSSKQSIEVIPFRWSVKETLTVVIDPRLGNKFREELIRGLKERIAGKIQYLDEMSLTNNDSNAVWFRLGSKENGGVDIYGPEQLLGGSGPVRSWRSQGETEEKRARESVIALAHLLRFGQILHLRNDSQNTKPFEVKLEYESGVKQQKVLYVFQNNQNEELHFAVLILSPGFHVKQLFPATNNLQLVPSKGCRSFKFNLTVPPELRRNETHNREHVYRDIIRTVVIRGKSLSLKSMELPNIWDADQWNDNRSSGSGRDGDLLDEFSWWMQDESRIST